VWYGVPEALKLALQYGYISPNLPAPLGMVWVARRDALSAFATVFSQSAVHVLVALWFGFCVGFALCRKSS
jgi:hypothetical protein